MSYRIDEIEGIGPIFADRLAEADIRTTRDLLEKCNDSRGRRTISQRTGVSEGQILKWANMADLMRISGIGSQYSELLEAAGVDTVKELRQRNPDNLTSTLVSVQADKRVARRSPTASMVVGWVEQARSLEPMIRH